MFWRMIAWILSRPSVANWLIERAKETPYLHIEKDGDVYMERYWVFNPYRRGPDKQERSKYPWFPWNIRIHLIRRPDLDRHMHDHPWNARTIILKGGYVEKRLVGRLSVRNPRTGETLIDEEHVKTFTRPTGATAKIGFGMYHKITHIQAGGAWTLFISGPYQGTWGFLVDGVKVQWRKYLGLEK